MLERFARGIELAETERGGSEIELAIEISGLEPGDLRTPRHGLRPVLFLARFRQDVKGRKRIVMQTAATSRAARVAPSKSSLASNCRGLFQQTASPASRYTLAGRKCSKDEAKAKTRKERSRRKCAAAGRSKSEVPAASPLYAAFAPDASNMFCHRGISILASGDECNCREASGWGAGGRS